MRDGQGTKLTDDEADKVKAAVKPKEGGSLNQVSVDPAATEKPESDGDDGVKRDAPDAKPTF